MAADGRSTARRAELLDAADRVISVHGPAASMTAIAGEAGITKPILYRHFGDKGGLYQALAERYVAPLLTELRKAVLEPESRYERMVSAVDTYLGFIEDHPQTYRFLMHRALSEQPEARSTVAAFIRLMGAEVAEALRTGFDLDDPRAAEAWGQGIVGMVQVAGDWWLEQEDLTREAMVAHLSQLLWSGLGAFEPEP